MIIAIGIYCHNLTDSHFDGKKDCSKFIPHSVALVSLACIESNHSLQYVMVPAKNRHYFRKREPTFAAQHLSVHLPLLDLLKVFYFYRELFYQRQVFRVREVGQLVVVLVELARAPDLVVCCGRRRAIGGVGVGGCDGGGRVQWRLLHRVRVCCFNQSVTHSRRVASRPSLSSKAKKSRFLTRALHHHHHSRHFIFFLAIFLQANRCTVQQVWMGFSLNMPVSKQE